MLTGLEVFIFSMQICILQTRTKWKGETTRNQILKVLKRKNEIYQHVELKK